MTTHRLRFGIFLPPMHAPDENPMLALERDFQLTELADDLGFDEMWFGEHHSGGWEINANPELAIATAAQRTRHIKLGMGVASVPYHHPLMLAARVRQIDLLSRGRAIFGVGPGSLPSDAYMMGIPTPRVRDRLDQALEPLVRLLRGETVSMKTDWFTLDEARLQLPSYTVEGVEIAVANQVSPTGSRLAGKFGLSLLSIGATSAGGFNALASNWAIAEDMAAEHGRRVDRKGWRLVGPMHIAPTREQARAEVEWGFSRWIDYFRHVAALPMAPAGVDPIQAMIDSGFAVIGTPDDAITQIQRLVEQSGGFGCFLHLGLNWAEFVHVKRSYEMFARYVIPEVNHLNDGRVASEQWLRNNHDRFTGAMKAAVADKIAQHAAEKGDGNIAPDIKRAFNLK